MASNNDNGSTAKVFAFEAKGKSQKPALLSGKENRITNDGHSKGLDGRMGVGSLAVPSTDTTLGTVSTKIDDQQDETELLLLDLNMDAKSDHDNDSCSVSTSTSSGSSVMSRYFEPTDFLPWEELYSKAEYAPHVGFAMVAGGFACMHPSVFMAGVVTAVGALRAAGATYEYVTCMQGSTAEGINEKDPGANEVLISCDWLSSAIGYNAAEDSPARGQLGDIDSIPPLAKTSSSCSTYASTIGDLSEDANGTNVANVEGPCVPSIIKSPPKVHISKEEILDPVEWVKTNVPTLSIVALKNVEFRGLNAPEFFDVFFADDAPFGFPAFHKLRRDKEVKYGSWNNGVTSSTTESKNIEFPTSTASKERFVEYHAKTNSFLGPAYAPTKKTQRAYFVSKKMLVIDIMMTLHDIPFSKQFYLIERWVIDGTRGGSDTPRTATPRSTRKKHKHGHSGSTSTRHSSSHCVYLTVSSHVYFTQECPFESAVVKESAKQVCEISKCWNAMAQDGLKRTEETRTRRLLQKQEEERRNQLGQEGSTTAPSQSTTACNDSNFDNDESIEIEHIDNPSGGNSTQKRRGGRRRSLTRSIRSSLSQPQIHDLTQPQRVQNRNLSLSFTKLVRGSSSNLSGETSQDQVEFSPPKVRISAAGITSCEF